MIACLLCALEDIHDAGIIHKDVKLENLVLDEDGYPRLTDFGLAQRYKPNMKSLGAGTLGYIAPEMINQEVYGFYSDFFAVGVVAFLFMRM